MDEPRWRRVQEIFQIACELEEGPRLAYVSEECGEDLDLAKEVESLLFYHERSDSFLKSSAVNQALDVIQYKKESPPGLPDSIGAYKIHHVIEHGGMGSVYVAEQLEPVRRFVALKVMHVGMNHDEFLARFQYEHQALAMMNHPNIAHVYDAGRTSDGRPFFTMEYISGLPINEHCKRHKLTIDERLKLFLKVCEGVQHAHRKGLIHRDLKPSNIMVSLETRRSVPKIIDFGIAKALDQGTGHKTRAGTILGTPAYMSPEQANYQDVDTAADVYSLGMILYELLAGVLPFEDEVYNRPPLEVLEIIRDEEPPRPSQRVAGLLEEITGLAKDRKTDPQTFLKILKGDLDWVVLKALEKSSGMRYGSVSELAADIGRYLNGAPVQASPTSTFYVVKKYVRRNRARVLLAAALLIGLVTAVAGLSVGLFQATKARERARAEAERANQTSEMIIGMTEFWSPLMEEYRKTKFDRINESLDSMVKPTKFTAQLKQTLGVAYLGIGEYDQAVLAFKQSIEIGREMLSPTDRLVLKSRRLLAFTYKEKGHLDQAMEILAELIRIKQDYGKSDQDKLEYSQALVTLAETLQDQSKFEQAQLYYDEAYQLQSKMDKDSPELLTVRNSMCNNLLAMGRLMEAEKVIRDVYQTRVKLFGPNNPKTLTSLHSLAQVLMNQGRYYEAELEGKRAFKLRSQVMEKDSPNLLKTENNLALTLMHLGKVQESLRHSENVLEQRTKKLGEDNLDTLQALNNLADGYLQAGLLDEAEDLKNKEYAILERLGKTEDPKFIYYRVTLGEVYIAQGRFEEAECLLREIFFELFMIYSIDFPNVAIAGTVLGQCLVARGKYDEAEDLLLFCWKSLRRARHGHQDNALQALFLCYDEWGKVDRSDELAEAIFADRRRAAENSAFPNLSPDYDL